MDPGIMIPFVLGQLNGKKEEDQMLLGVLENLPEGNPFTEAARLLVYMMAVTVSLVVFAIVLDIIFWAMKREQLRRQEELLGRQVAQIKVLQEWILVIRGWTELGKGRHEAAEKTLERVQTAMDMTPVAMTEKMLNEKTEEVKRVVEKKSDEVIEKIGEVVSGSQSGTNLKTAGIPEQQNAPEG
jgi:cytochrome bd-type quinol oxidase subunit 1